MTVVVEELIVTLSARLDQYQTQLNSMGRETDRRLMAIERRFDEFSNRLQSSVSRAAMAVTSSLGAVLSTRELADYADTWTRVGRAIEGTQQIYGITLATAKDIAALAMRTRSDLEATSTLYNRTAIAVSKLGMDTKVAVSVTETFAKALKLGGATAAEQASVMVQFSQALTKGTLNGDEFRSIMENAGVVQQALIEKFKVSGKALIEMAEKGKITAKDVIAALIQIKPKVDTAYGNAPATLAESFTNLKTAIAEYVGDANNANAVASTLGAGMQALANNLDTAGKLALVLGAELLVAFGPGIIGAIAGMGAGLVSIPALLAAGGAAAYLFSDRLVLSASSGVRANDVFLALGAIARDAVGKSAGWAAEQLQWMADVLSALIRLATDNPMSKAIGAELRILLQDVRDGFNGIIGASKYAALTVAAHVVDLFGALPTSLIGALNAALEHVEGFVKRVADLLNSLPGVKIDVDAIAFGKLTGDTIANQAAALRKQALDALSTDYIGKFSAEVANISANIKGMVDAVANAGNYVMDRALDEKIKRRWSSGMTVSVNRTPAPVYPDPPDKNKYTKEIEQITKKTELLAAEAAAVGKTASEQEKAKAMQELLTAAREAELAVTPQMLADMDKLATAYGTAHARLDLLRKIQQTKEDTASTQREIALTGLYGYELHRARVEAELLAEAKRNGTPLTDSLRQEIAQTAAANAATKQLSETLNAVRDTSQTALKSFISDLREGKSGAEALSGAISKIADKLIDMAANQLVEAALGGVMKGANGAGSGGGLLKLFGFAEGGVMTPAGPRGLNRYAAGGVSTRAAVFAEAGPEAAVPLPDGRRIPVELRMPNISAALQSPVPAAPSSVGTVAVNQTFNLSGGVSAADLARVKAEMAAGLPAAVNQGINQAFDRQARFRRSGL